MHKALATVATLILGICGGLAFDALGAPAAYLIGSACAITLGVVVGMPVHLPNSLRLVAFAVIGTMLGSQITPGVVDTILLLPLAVVGLALATYGATAASYLVLHRGAGWDRVTALCGSIPGAFSIVIAAAEDKGAAMERVLTAQALRLFILVSLVPLVLGGGAPTPTVAQHGVGAIAASFAIAVACGALAYALKAATTALLLPLAVAGTLSASGLVSVALPQVVADGAFAVLGAAVAVRFTAIKRDEAVAILGASFAAFVAAGTVAVAVAVPFAWLTAEPLGEIFLAYAPGGVDAMIALSFLLGYDVALVSMLHATRLVMLAVSVPLLLSFQVKRLARVAPHNAADAALLTHDEGERDGR